MNMTNYIRVSRDLIAGLGLGGAVLFGDLLALYTFLEKEGLLMDGWFYATTERLKERTGLSPYALRSAIGKLEKVGLIRCRLMGTPAKRHFRVFPERLPFYVSSFECLPKLQQTDGLIASQATSLPFIDGASIEVAREATCPVDNLPTDVCKNMPGNPSDYQNCNPSCSKTAQLDVKKLPNINKNRNKKTRSQTLTRDCARFASVFRLPPRSEVKLRAHWEEALSHIREKLRALRETYPHYHFPNPTQILLKEVSDWSVSLSRERHAPIHPETWLKRGEYKKGFGDLANIVGEFSMMNDGRTDVGLVYLGKSMGVSQ